MRTIILPILLVGMATNAFAAASVDVSVRGQTTGIVVYSGTADVCNGSQCVVVGAGCGVASVSPGSVDVLGNEAKAPFLKTNFPFAVDQDVLQPDFHAAVDACALSLSTPLDQNDDSPTLRGGSPE